MRVTWLLLALTGCGGLGPGDYAVYRIAFSTAQQSDSCFGDGGRPVDIVGDTTSYLDAGTFAIYRTDDKQFLLEEGGGVVLTGTETKDGFTFDAQNVDIEYFGSNDANSTTTTVTEKVVIKVNGASVSGVQTVETEVICNGTECTDAGSDCTQTVDFVGSAVDDVNLQHNV